MSFWSRYATRAVQRENVRLTERIAKLADDLRKANRDLGAASERNTQHIRNAVQAAENALAVGVAYDKVRAEYDRVADALTFVTSERDEALARVVELEAFEEQAERDLAEIERLETEQRTLSADLLETQGRLADLEERLAFSHNQTDRANAQLSNALNVPFVTTGQRYDLDDVGQEKRSMDRGDE